MAEQTQVVNKHKALQTWVQTFLDDNYLSFESAEAYPNIRVIVPEYGDYMRYEDICGFRYKSYTFVFIGYEQIDTGTSDVNVDNMGLFDLFNEWIITQQRENKFPDFGNKCDEYELYPLQNMANLASISPDGLAKYMLAVRIDYREEGN